MLSVFARESEVTFSTKQEAAIYKLIGQLPPKQQDSEIIIALERQITEQDAIIERQGAKLTRHDAKISEQEEQLGEQAETIKNISEECEARASKEMVLVAQVMRQEEEIKELKERVEALQVEIFES
jgi:predicted metal-dependent hydrolase